MLIDVNIFSIVLLESFGIVSFLLALVFFKQYRRISDKQESLKKTTVDQIWNGPCYSYKWVVSHTLKPRKIIETSPFLAVGAFFIGWFIFFYLSPWIVCLVPGSLTLIVLIGVAILLETDAFEAYSYGRAVQKAPLSRLNREDQSYMELAKESLEKAIVRFLLIGVIFTIAGPFTPQILDGLIYTLITYTTLIFRTSEASKEVSLTLAFVIAAVLAAILLYIPELMGRTIFRRVKLQAQRIWERWRKR